MNLEHMIAGKKSKGVKAIAAGLAVAAGLTSAGCMSPFRNIREEFGYGAKAPPSDVKVEVYQGSKYLQEQGIPVIHTLADYNRAISYRPSVLHVFCECPKYGSTARTQTALYAEIKRQHPDILFFGIESGVSSLESVYSMLPVQANARNVGILLIQNREIISSSTLQQLSVELRNQSP